MLVDGPTDGRTWWAHVEFTRMNIALTIRRNQIEDPPTVGQSMRRDVPLPEESSRAHRVSVRQRCQHPANCSRRREHEILGMLIVRSAADLAELR